MVDGDCITEKTELAASVVNFYKELFQEEIASPLEDQLVDCIPELVTAEDNAMLVIHCIDKIKGRRQCYVEIGYDQGFS
ncbi:hypothetical protein LIER_19551 [Lithospermum erythrorhizon]|uniref:Uncharacterized protein n=1 Tax=Lithospermum erythrorhizon TaxID=34254 RepID=A0AAV3QLY5_LITER